MSDIKRAVFTTLEPQKISGKSEKKHSKTVRIHVALPESNEDKCPEFNYKDELAAAKKKIKQNVKEPSQVPNGLDPFGDENDDDVRRIALEMEAKYGTGVTSGGPKKKRKGRKDDYADIGAGYDENDSFIDNTDGYDEMIPPNVTTVRGGFYINSGALEFKTDDEASSGVSSSSSEGESGSEEEEEEQGEEEGGGQSIKRKRVLDSSDEDNEVANTVQSPEEGQQPELNGEKPSITMHQAIKKKLFSTEKIQIKKSKLNNIHKTTVKELLREKRNNFQSGDGSKDGSKENKKPMRLSSVQDAIDSVLANGVVSRDVMPGDKVQNQLMDGVLTAQDERVLDPSFQEVVKLPENLPEDILEIIEKIKRSAENYKDGGKVKFFSGDVNIFLLNLERKCKILGRSSRVRVYEHLAPFVKCRKETLVKRARNLVYVEDSKKLANTKENLKNQICKLMPALITNHDKECQRVMQRKFSQEAAMNEELKNLKAPRRRFPLHDEMKRMLRDIVMLKKRGFLHEGKSKENLEELLSNYLKQEILTLWPEGWMSMTVLKKYCTPLALKTPDPKANLDQARQLFSKTLPNALVGASLTGTNSVTITPVNLAQRLTDVGNNNSQDTIIQTVLKSPEKSVEKPLVTPKDNGVIVLGNKTREVKQSSPVDCPIIDLTDTPVVKTSVIEPTVVKKPSDFLSHSLKTMQKFAEVSQPAVSVIAFNKNYSNSGACTPQVSTLPDRTSFSGALSYKDDYQRRLHNSLPSHSKTNSPSTAKPGYNGCS